MDRNESEYAIVVKSALAVQYEVLRGCLHGHRRCSFVVRGIKQDSL